MKFFELVDDCFSLFRWGFHEVLDETPLKGTKTVKSLEIFPWGIHLVGREIKGKLQSRIYWVSFSLSVNRHFSFGMRHDYYDGPHHSFSLGFVHLYWQPKEWCQKCSDGA